MQESSAPQQRQPADGGLPSAVNRPGAVNRPDAGADSLSGAGTGDGDDGGAEPARGLSRPQAVAAAVVGGVLAAVLGTALQAQVLYLGGTGLPWGAVAALVLSGSISLWVGLSARSIWFTAGTGVLTYVLVGLLAAPLHGSALIVSADARGAMLGIGLAGNIWVVGIAAVTIVAAVLCRRFLGPQNRR